MEKKLIEEEKLRLLGLKSSLELSTKIDEKLVNKLGYNPEKNTLMLNVSEPWFNDGCQKVVIADSIRDTHTVICTDPYNYSLTYNMRGLLQHTSPNDLIQQLRDAIGACNAHTNNLTVLMPMLYNGRQHRRKGREALSCANWLRELDDINAIKRIITCDAHDPGVEQALKNTEFDNLFLTNVMLEEFINNTPSSELENLVFIAPDNGAIARTTVYLNSFDNDQIKRELGFFYKERDYNVIKDGKNPIKEHRYSGNENIAGKTAIVVDDMIASGSSLIDVIDKLNSLGVYNIYIFATFTLFTNGIDIFDKYYQAGKFKAIYTTNATYINELYRSKEWLKIADCSSYLTDILYAIYTGKSITPIMNDKSAPGKLLTKKLSH